MRRRVIGRRDGGTYYDRVIINIMICARRRSVDHGLFIALLLLLLLFIVVFKNSKIM